MTITVDYCRWKYLTMFPPAGASAANIEALYQFNKHTDGLLDLSGNGHHLTNRGGYQDYYSPTEESLGVAGLELRANYWAHGPTGLYPGTTGPWTLEFLWTPTLWTEDNDFVIAIGDGAGSEAEEDNITCEIVLLNTYGDIGVIHERGNGVNVGTTWFEHCGNKHNTQLVGVTRAGDGVTHKLFQNGIHVDTIVMSNPPTGGDGSDVKIMIGGSSAGNDLYAYLHSLRYAKELYSDAQMLQSYQACRDLSCGAFLSTSSTVDIDRVVVIAQDVIRLDFTGPVVATPSLSDPDSYSITGGLAVKSVLPIEGRVTSSVFLQLIPKATWRTDYEITLPSAGTDKLVVWVDLPLTTIYKPDGEPLQTMSAQWTHHRTKVDSVLASMPGMFDLGISSNLRMILQAIANSDEEIGGDF
jgi:hypothetical protein